MRKYLAVAAIALTVIVSGVSTSSAQNSQPAKASTRLPGIYAVLQTNMGTIVCKLFDKVAPLAVENFIGLAEGTKEFTEPS